MKKQSINSSTRMCLKKDIDKMQIFYTKKGKKTMKSKISGKIRTFILTLIIAVISCVPLQAKEAGDKANSFRYKNGRPIAEAMPFSSTFSGAWKKINGKYYSSDGSVIEGAVARGIDVSRHQGVIDWKKVKADGVEFAMIRCGYGMNQTDQDDSQWLNNVTGCEQNGIPYGVYLYSYADTVAKAKSEAEHVLRLVKGHKLSYPIYYDMEDDSVLKTTTASLRADIAETFTNIIKKAGYSVGVFASKSWFENYLPASTFDKWNRWVAHWNTKCGYKGKYQLWQATKTGTVDGITGNVDIDFAIKTTSASSGNSTGSTTKKPVTSTESKKNTSKAVKLRTPTIKLKNIAKKKVQLSWNQRGNGIKVQVFYSTKKNKGYKKAATLAASKGKVIIKKGLKSKKKYYFKVRCFKKVKGRTYYSTYSKIKSLVVK